MNFRLCVVASVVMLAGCSATEINQASQDAMNGAMNGAMGSVFQSAGLGHVVGAVGGTGGHAPGAGVQHNVGREGIYSHQSKRSSRDYGQLTVSRTERNPQGRTLLALESCGHPRIGSLGCNGHIYELTPEGWLIDKSISFGGSNYSLITVAAGTYYVKLESSGTGQGYNATGDVTLQPFVTNFLTVQLE